MVRLGSRTRPTLVTKGPGRMVCRATPLAVYLPSRLLDLLHSAFIVKSFLNYLIDFFGDRTRIDYIPWSVALSVVITAGQTLITHWYFARKIYKSSGKNWWITGPIVLLAFLRLFAACVGLHDGSLPLGGGGHYRYRLVVLLPPKDTGENGVDHVRWPINLSMCYTQRPATRRMAHVVDTLTLYTLENELITCVTATASLWLIMPNNLMFLSLHFLMAKLYANSLLISLNTRKELREMRWTKSEWDRTVPVLTADDFRVPSSRSYAYGTPDAAYRPAFKVNPRVLPSQLEVNVEGTVERTSEDLAEMIQRDYTQGRRNHRPRSPRHTVDPWRSLP
ncbi:hypothetical protein C8R43DRAFT_1136391 [Mycena crocata]|nr:hypothetical protein C8R43DRAFT_1136391 [Mycena crocata]